MNYPPQSYVEDITHIVIVSGDRAFKEVIKVKLGHKDSSNRTNVLIRREKDIRDVHTEQRPPEDIASRGQFCLQAKERGFWKNQTC